MIRRLLKIFAVLAVLVVLGVGFGLPAYYSTETGAKKTAEQIGKALGRQVEIGKLDIGWFFLSLDLEKLRVSNPEGWPEGDLLRADSFELDTKFQEIVTGVMKGSAKGSGLRVHILKRGDETNLDGLARPDEDADEDRQGDVELDLSLDLEDSTLVIEDLDKNEKLVVDGVSASLRLTNRDRKRDLGLKIRIAQIERGGLQVRDIELDARQDGDFLQLEKLAALLPGRGRLAGTGALRVRGGDEWNASLKASEVGVTSDMVPLVSTVYPLAAAAGGQIDGVLDATFDLRGRGLTWQAMKPTLAGDAEVRLTGLSLGSQSLVGLITTVAGRGEGQGPLALNDAGAVFRIENGWLHFNRLSASGDEVRYDLAGRVSLDGKLDLSIDALPVLERFGGGRYKDVVNRLEKFPIPVGGTTARPRLQPPDLKDLLRQGARGLLEEEAKKALGDKAGDAVGGILDRIREQGGKKKKEEDKNRGDG